MFLKSLTMHGFKSFPDKTVISFDRGITAIVGPNGSGKSNISDAVRWVLGEMSPKSLRGSKMEDVIFNGTSKRKQAGYAEVTMTLDNTDRRSSFDADEIDVCRRLYRSGESEYYINNKQVRLKDIVDIFLNTGIGREGYSVIGQGKIADVISRKNDERRGIFEEAAGISRLRYQKKEAVSKLEKVGDNLSRIGDILGEVESRLPSLKRQSEKAEKYTELKTERTELEVSSFAQRIATIDKEKEKVGENLALEEKSLADAETALEESDKKIDENYLETGREKALEGRLRNEREELLSKLSAVMSELSILENDTEHFDTTKAEVNASIADSNAKIGQLDADREALLKALEDTKAELEENARRTTENANETQAVRNSIFSLRDEVKEAEAEREAIAERRAENDLILKEGESYNAIRRERLETVKAQKDSLDSALKKANREKADNERATAEKTAEKDELREGLDRDKETLDTFEEKCEELAEKKQKLRLKLMETNQRRETLERMERLLEGFSGSVKSVMSASHDKELSGIHGPVSKLIVTDPEYITAIETCLGAAMQNIVVENEDSAKAAIAFLKRTNSGRATFLPLTTVKGSLADVREVKNKKGFISIASELVRCDDKYRDIVNSLLGRTVVCDTIESATPLARALNFRVRIITLDGQLINAGGSYTGGQTLKSSAILTRRADIEELEKEGARLEAEISAVNTEISDRQKEKSAIESSFLEREREEELLVRALFELEKEYSVCLERIASLEETLKGVNAEYDSLYHTENVTRDSMSEFEKKKELIEAEFTSASERRDSLEKKVLENEERLLELNAEAGELSARHTELEVELASFGERLEGIANMRAANESAIVTANARLSELDERRVSAERGIADKLIEKASLGTDISAKDNEIKECAERITRLEAESLDIRATQKSLTDKKETSFRLVTQLKAKLDELENEKVSILTRLAEDYEMDFDMAVVFASSSHSNHSLSKEEREERLAFLRAEMKKLGNVNLDSIEEYRETKERYDFLKAQFDDATSAKASLERMIVQLDATMREKFSESLIKIQKAFKETFVELFGGGSAEIIVSGDDVLECSIDINVQPPGKIIKSLSLLSGGEQSIVAIALYLAILKVSPSPFCIFDEIEAALDDANVARFGEYLKKYSLSTQFIVITHRRGTMEAADILYGITMQEKGVSDYIRVSLDEYQGEIN
ncbi:MAG: chromosome segregation protein SMC [Clostridia bacterium]|nr:chromosome segregation protein SMC [Clostridia bacterium]